MIQRSSNLHSESMKALMTDEMLAGIDIFFHLPSDLQWRRLPGSQSDGFHYSWSVQLSGVFQTC